MIYFTIGEKKYMLKYPKSNPKLDPNKNRKQKVKRTGNQPKKHAGEVGLGVLVRFGGKGWLIPVSAARGGTVTYF